jgi:AraC-type DNA-binding domain-containing proteins
MEYDTTVNSIIKYINENLSRNLSIDILSEKFFVSRYYIMHRFKTCTGYSIHNYIVQKRLIMANALIKSGKPATEASLECGFNDYSSFMRAFKKMFGHSPRQYLKNKLSNESTTLVGH